MNTKNELLWGLWVVWLPVKEPSKEPKRSPERNPYMNPYRNPYQNPNEVFKVMLVSSETWLLKFKVSEILGL